MLPITTAIKRLHPIPTEYDSLFREVSERWLPFLDWHWLKAQGYQESLLRPDAVSPVGAKGIMQCMDPTFAEARKSLGLHPDASPFDPEHSIYAGAWYMRRMWNAWTSKREDSDHLKLAQASYNAGLGNILKAQAFAHGATEYAPIIAQLVRVTGAENAAQTRTYVERIERYYKELTDAE